MRILFHLIDAEVAGGQLVAERIAREAVSRGHEVGALLPEPGPMLDRFAGFGSRIHPSALNSLRRVRAIYPATTLLSSYDVLYSHTSVPGQILGDLAARLTRRAHVIHEHSDPYFSPTEPVRWLQHRAFEALRPAKVIAVGRHVAETLVARGVDRSVIEVVPNGAPEIEVQLKGSSSGIVRVGMMGRLDPGKGIDEFVSAVEPLCANGITAEIAGRRGPFKDYEAQLDGRLTRVPVGLVETENSESFLERLDIVAIPSHYEGSPLILFEAMAHGKAIVASDIPGIREVVRDGDSGLLVPPCDVGSLRRAITLLVNNPHQRAALGEAARKDARERFPMSTTVNRCLEILEEVAESWAPR